MLGRGKVRDSPSSPRGFAGQRFTLFGLDARLRQREAAKGEAWCPWPESNQHSLRNSILSRARLPVPPQGPSVGPKAGVAKRADYSHGQSGVNPRQSDPGRSRQPHVPGLRALESDPSRRGCRDDPECRNTCIQAGGHESRAGRLARGRTLIAAATIAGAWFFQLVLEILPCPLCLEQRYAYYLAIPLGAAHRARGAGRCAAAAAARGPCDPRAGGARQCRARHLSLRRRMGLLEGTDRLLRSRRQSRQRRRPAVAARHREGGALRRGAVALPRPLARRLQRADLAVDGRDRRVGICRDGEALGSIIHIVLRPAEQVHDARASRSSRRRSATGDVRRRRSGRCAASGPAPAWRPSRPARRRRRRRRISPAW